MVSTVEDLTMESNRPGMLPRIRRWYRPSNLLILAGLISLGVAWPARKNWLPDVSQRPEFFLPVEQIRITQPPRWVPKNLLQQVLSRGQFPAELPVLAPSLAPQLAKRFSEHPWVAKVIQVRIDAVRSRTE